MSNPAIIIALVPIKSTHTLLTTLEGVLRRLNLKGLEPGFVKGCGQ